MQTVSNTGANGWATASAIQHAADQLGPGDIILVELQQPGPRSGFQAHGSQKGYIPVEWWGDNLTAIQYATNKGVIVAEACSNGQEDLDDAIYDQHPPAPYGPLGSPWHNPFKRDPINSGAIIVGAGATPPGTHGFPGQRDRSRFAAFSNYGTLFDAQGWGLRVETCGWGAKFSWVPMMKIRDTPCSSVERRVRRLWSRARSVAYRVPVRARGCRLSLRR